MPWNGAGTYSLPPAYSPEVNGTIIDAVRYNGLTSDVAAGITNALAKDGQNVPTANLPMGGFKHTGAAQATGSGQYLVYGQTGTASLGGLLRIGDGTEALPGLAFGSDTDTGLWKSATNEIGFATGATGRFYIASGHISTVPVAERPDFNTANPAFAVSGLASFNSTTIGIVRNSNGDTAGPILAFGKNNNASTTSYATAVTSGQFLVDIRGYGSDTATLRQSGYLRNIATGTFSPTSTPSKWTFATPATGSITNTVRMDLDENGAWFMGATQGWLGISENGTFSGATANSASDTLVLDGSGNVGMSVLSGATSAGAVLFGRSGAASAGRVQYAHSSDVMQLYAGSALRVSLDSTSFVFEASVDPILDTATGPSSTLSMGFRGIPQNSRSADYTCVLSDAGKHIYHPSGGGAGDDFTIPSNASVPFPIGTTITFVNRDSNSITIPITTDTLTWAPSGATGTRTLAQYGIATALKITSTEWLISGVGLS